MSDRESPTDEQRAMASTVTALHLPQLVFNSFANDFSASEVTSTISFGPRLLATLIMPPVVAKTFALALLDAVSQYEAATGVTVSTIDEISQRMSAHAAKRAL